MEGRQVVTFHNQRDYIFVRHHRYKFKPKSDKIQHIAKQQAKAKQSKQDEEESKKKMTDEELQEQHVKKVMGTNLQELGPRFTLKLRWLQEGTFDTQFGEYEWIHKRKEMDTTRRKFHL